MKNLNYAFKIENFNKDCNPLGYHGNPKGYNQHGNPKGYNQYIRACMQGRSQKAHTAL